MGFPFALLTWACHQLSSSSCQYVPPHKHLIEAFRRVFGFPLVFMKGATNIRMRVGTMMGSFFWTSRKKTRIISFLAVITGYRLAGKY